MDGRDGFELFRTELPPGDTDYAMQVLKIPYDSDVPSDSDTRIARGAARLRDAHGVIGVH